MRSEADREKILRLLHELGHRAKGPGTVYLVDGSSVVLLGKGREWTIDVDLKLDPEPPGVFEAIAELKNTLDVNVELAAPDQFIPALPGWKERSQFIDTIGSVEFYHYDFYSQALAKLERGHDRDLRDVEDLVAQGLVAPDQLLGHFKAIEAELIRFPSVNAGQLRRAVDKLCSQANDDSA